MTDPTSVIDFEANEAGAWRAINDRVMGGLSRSGLRRTDRGTGVFEGVLSLANSGGFASVRTAVGPHDLSPYNGLEIRVRGDGRTYQLRLRTESDADGIAYRADVETSDGEWTTSRIEFDRFVPTYRGRTLRDVPPLDTARIHQVVILLGDKRPGAFSLEIAHVRAWSADTVVP